MNIVGKLFSNMRGFYNEINPATLTGAIDVVVIRQSDGTYTTSPWHVRFGKMGVIRASQKVVSDSIYVDCGRTCNIASTTLQPKWSNL